RFWRREMERAYALFEVKDFDEKQGIVQGVATSITPDRMEDVVDPSGAKFKLPLILLNQHNSDLPVGHVIEAKQKSDRIDVVTRLVNPDEARSDTVRERLLSAWDDVRLKLKRAFSIGFKSLAQEPIKGTFGYRFLEWEWLELSLVTIPANAEATITTIKSIDSQLLAASGRSERRVVRLVPASPVGVIRAAQVRGPVQLIPRE